MKRLKKPDTYKILVNGKNRYGEFTNAAQCMMYWQGLNIFGDNIAKLYKKGKLIDTKQFS